MDEKKFKIANRISFIFFSLYLLTYILLPIVEKNASYSWFLIFPIIFFIGLIINIILKYNKMKPGTMGKFSKIAAIANIMFNGSIASSLYVGTMDWETKTKKIKKYPSITPTWLFVILFATILSNIIFFASLSDTRVRNLHISWNVILIVSIISIVFILFGLISSTFSLYYNNGKKEAFRFWKIIGVVVLGLIILAVCSAYLNGFSIKEEIHQRQVKEDFEKHKQNIERTLKNN